jgi:hypothetical protein
MKYYVSERTIKAIRGGWPMCDVYLPVEPTTERARAIDISIIANCFSCDSEFVLAEHNEREGGDFCDRCLTVHY